MLKLKAIYISSFVTFVLVASGYGAYRAIEGPPLPWIGALLTTLPAALFFVRVYTAGDVARTSPRMHAHLALGLLGVAISASAYLTNPEHLGALLLAVAGVLSVFAYTYWYSNLPRGENRALRVGERLPDFQLETEQGQVVESSAFVGKPLLLLFYRGNWCPLCMAQIKEVAAQYRELEARGVQVVCVSPQPHRNTRDLAKKFDVPLQLLVDADHRAAKRLGIFAKDGLPAGLQVFGYSSDTVWPTVIITDAEGRIRFADLTDNYRVRPEPAMFLPFFDRRVPAAT